LGKNGEREIKGEGGQGELNSKKEKRSSGKVIFEVTSKRPVSVISMKEGKRECGNSPPYRKSSDKKKGNECGAAGR